MAEQRKRSKRYANVFFEIYTGLYQIVEEREDKKDRILIKLARKEAIILRDNLIRFLGPAVNTWTTCRQGIYDWYDHEKDRCTLCGETVDKNDQMHLRHIGKHLMQGDLEFDILN